MRGQTHSYGCGFRPMGSHFGVGEFTTHFRTYASWDWDVDWGYGLLTHAHILKVPYMGVGQKMRTQNGLPW